MQTKYTVTNIKWDTDGQEINLPTEMIVMVDNDLSDYEKSEVISDHISNETGFCHKGFSTFPEINE